MDKKSFKHELGAKFPSELIEKLNFFNNLGKDGALAYFIVRSALRNKRKSNKKNKRK